MTKKKIKKKVSAKTTAEKKETKTPSKTTVKCDSSTAMIVVIALIIGLIIGGLATAAVMPVAEQSSLDESELTTMVSSYLNENLVLDPSFVATITDSNMVGDGLYEMNFEVSQDGAMVGEGVVYATADYVILGQAFNMNEPVEQPEPPAPAELAKQEVADAELYIWGYCPAGVSTLDTYAEAAYALKDSANVSVVLFHDGHGAYETQQNKIQAAIQQLEPENYWAYAKDFYEDVYPVCSQAQTVECDLVESTKLMEKVGIDATAVMALVEAEGDALIAIDQAKAAALGIGASPTLVVNGTVLDGFDRTADGIKTTVCLGFEVEPEVCAVALSGAQTVATGSC
jgi:hypothetical protein